MATRRLVLLANAFPFGSWEPFLETELPYYEGFDAIEVFSLSVREDQRSSRRAIARDDVKVHPISYRAQWIYLLNSLRILVNPDLYREISRLWSTRKLSAANVVTLFVFLSRSNLEAREIKRILKKTRQSDQDSTVIYSYRAAYQPYLAQLIEPALRGRVVHVARGHGADLYEERSPRKYLPMRGKTFQKLAVLNTIAQAGSRYLKESMPELDVNVEVSYLGTSDFGVGPQPVPGSPLHILTNSSVVQVKRLDRVVETLSRLKDLPVVWTHFGDGPLMDDLRKRCAQELGPNVDLRFKGSVPNVTLLSELQEQSFDLIVNVSESEGIPVSLMEAFSFGIPAIATDVGGVGEIVEDGVNWRLLSPEFESQELETALREYSELPSEQRLAARRSARTKWESTFRAENNYTEFARTLCGLLD